MAANIASSNSIYRVAFSTPLPANATAGYVLADFERRRGAGWAVRRSYFHDQSGSGGRFLVKAPDGIAEDNVMARFGGIHVTAEQNWLEGSLGLRNVSLSNTTLVDAGGTVTVLAGVPDVSCANTTVVRDGRATEVDGCAMPALGAYG